MAGGTIGGFQTIPIANGQLVIAGKLSDYELMDGHFSQDSGSIATIYRNGSWVSADGNLFWYIKHKAKANRVQRFLVNFRRKGTTTIIPQKFNIYFHTSNNN